MDNDDLCVAPAAPPTIRRVALASSLGAIIEWYDFFIYGTRPRWSSTSCSSRNFGGRAHAGSRSRPSPSASSPARSAALVFGHLGDRVGRKRMLILTLLIMGAATLSSACSRPTDRSESCRRSCWS